VGYHIVRPPTPDAEFVNVCNGDLRRLDEAREVADDDAQYFGWIVSPTYIRQLLEKQG
jgi:hypothetical protein